MSVPVIPETAPFSAEQRAWLNGFFAGMFSRAPGSGNSAASATPALTPLTVLFASQTGTAERLAKKAAKLAGKRGFAPTVLDASQASIEKLSQENAVLFVSSTYGEGEPPDNAKGLLSTLRSTSGTPLANLRYSLCALGDSKYAKFCQAGKDFDQLFEKLGATPVSPRIECDVGEDDKYTKWLDVALASFSASASPSTTTTAEEEEDDEPRPFLAPVLAVTRLTGEGSAKEVNHVVFSLKDSGLTYAAGDALSVTPINDPALVGDMLSALGCDGEEAVSTGSGEVSLRHALASLYDLSKPTAELLALLGKNAESPAPFHVIDALLAATTKPKAQDFIATLKKLQPRLYSISSSPVAHPDEVHLTVGAVRYENSGRQRTGVCSLFLAERALAASKVAVGVHPNNSFRLPANGDLPVIMIGPGTGIAPFRAFLEARASSGAKGKNWLFFGDQHEKSDFLYRDEILAWQSVGLLTRLDLAWSRDQKEKVYVQHKILAAAAELWSWLEAGAHVYICGDASRMAKDVHHALLQVIQTAGGRSSEDAAKYIEILQTAKRYLRDVY